MLLRRFATRRRVSARAVEQLRSKSSKLDDTRRENTPRLAFGASRTTLLKEKGWMISGFTPHIWLEISGCEISRLEHRASTWVGC